VDPVEVIAERDFSVADRGTDAVQSIEDLLSQNPKSTRSAGDLEASVGNGLLALRFLTDSGDLLRQSKVHSTLARAFTQTALHEAALRHVLAALATARACADPTAEFWALTRYSRVQESMGDLQRAWELSQQALALARTLDDAEAGFAALINLGDICQAIAREHLSLGLGATPAMKEALGYMEEAVGLANLDGHAYGEAIARNNAIAILIDLGEYAEAREQGKLAKVIAKTNGYRSLEVAIDVQQAEVVRAEGRIDLATTLMHSLAADPDLEEYPVLLTKLHRALFEMHKESGRFEQALRTHEELHRLVLHGTTEAAGLQSQVLINTLEIEQARHDAERSQFEAQVQRLRAEEMDIEANTDPLTRLPNRRALDRQLPRLMDRAEDLLQSICAAMIDFDHFKLINDEHGHATGDDVLSGMAVMLRAVTRDTDLAVRVAGEEFLLVFGNTTVEEASKACERLLASVRGNSWDGLAAGLTCTVSAGVAELRPGESASDWLARADAALYEAKRTGRDRVCTAPSS
jgi:diguanylate cyclase (GGDEF)-like protein